MHLVNKSFAYKLLHELLNDLSYFLKRIARRRLYPNLSPRNKAVAIAIKKYPTADIKVFFSRPVLLDFLNSTQLLFLGLELSHKALKLQSFNWELVKTGRFFWNIWKCTICTYSNVPFPQLNVVSQVQATWMTRTVHPNVVTSPHRTESGESDWLQNFCDWVSQLKLKRGVLRQK